MNKYRIFKFIAIAVALVITSGCKTEDEKGVMEWVELDKHILALVVPGQATLTATDKDVTWSSSDDAVATVDNSGKVTAVADGTAIITATTKDGKQSATCTVIVTSEIVKVTGVTLPSTQDLMFTKKGTLEPVITPNNATFKALTWSSSNSAVVSVDKNGGITAVTFGSATITGVTIDGSNISVKCEVNVVPLELVTNGDFKTNDLTTSFFFTNNANPEIVNDNEKGRVMKIVSETRLTNDWDLQFWVLLVPPAKKDEQYVFTMDVRSEKNCSFPTQAHYVPQNYTHWDIVGSIPAKPEWSTYTKTVTISADHVGGADKGSMGSIAFNLGQIETTVYIANVSLKRIK